MSKWLRCCSCCGDACGEASGGDVVPPDVSGGTASLDDDEQRELPPSDAASSFGDVFVKGNPGVIIPNTFAAVSHVDDGKPSEIDSVNDGACPIDDADREPETINICLHYVQSEKAET